MTESCGRRRTLLIYLCLALATAAVYWPVQHAGFITFDDGPYITENLHLREGLTRRGLRWALTTPLDQWMPVTWVARILEYRLFGLNAGPQHLVNLLFHIANTLLLFGVLNRMTGARGRSAVVAALFALHPLHVEPVAWVTGLKDVLSTWFGLLTIWAYARYVEHRGDTDAGSPITNHRSPFSPFYALTLFFFALALLSKPMLVTLPFVLLLLDYWPLGRTHWVEAASGKRAGIPLTQSVKEKLPFFVLAAAVCVVTYWARRSTGSVIPLERSPLEVRAITALLAYVRYVGQTIWPTGLAVFYPLRPGLSATAVIGAGVGLAGVTAAVIWRARREPWLVTGWFWYLGTLVPVIGLVQVGVVHGMADRYTYVPLIGLFVMVCWSVPWSASEPWLSRAITGGVAGVVIAACAVLSRTQVGYWKNSETLFQHALAVTRGNWLVHNNLGTALAGQGRVAEAIPHWAQAAKIRPDYAEAHYNLGNGLAQVGQVPEAIAQYERALQLKPDYAEAHNNLGLTLVRTGKVKEAIGHYEWALKTKPDFAQAHNDLGLALAQTGQFQEALAHYEQALRLWPGYAEAHNNLGNVLLQQGHVPEAIVQYEQALRFKPDYAEAHANLGTALLRAGRASEAIGHYEQALRGRLDSAIVHYNLGVALEEVGRATEATEHYERALRLKPDFAPAQNRLARLRTTR